MALTSHILMLFQNKTNIHCTYSNLWYSRPGTYNDTKNVQCNLESIKLWIL